MASGVIKQVVETQFTAKGANKVAKDTQKIGKEQTRLGQASASAGRAFSAQANGLGGLVGAYAGAAANVFAITAAFTALNQAARSEQTIDGLNRLAATFGQVGSEVLSSLQDITKGQLSIVETAQQANIALSAGLGPQLEGLTEVSLKASRALGRNLTDAFQRIVRGAGKLEPELLDELGIFARLDPAVEKYALQTGKTASSLTNFERRQAFANAVLEEGRRKFATINTTVPTTAEKLERLSATIANIGQQLGFFLANFLAPVAEFISNNLSAAVIAIGLLLRQLFGRALAGAATAFDGFITKVSGGLSNLALSAQTNNQAFQIATSQIAQSANKINPGTLFGGKQAQEGAKVLKFLREGGTISPADAKASAAALRDAANAQTKFKKTAEGATARANAQQASLNSLAKEVDNLKNRTNLYGAAATKVFNGVNAVALRLKSTLSTVLVFGNKFLLIVGIVEGVLAIVGQIFGKALSPIAFIARLIRDANAEARTFSGTLAEVASTIALTVNTAGLLPKQLEEATKQAGKSLQDVFNVSFIEAPITALGNTLEDIISLQSDLADATVKTAQVTKELNAAIEDATQRTKKFGTEGRQAFVELQILEKVQSLIESFGRQGASAFELLNQLSVRTGIAAGELFDLFKSGIITIDSQTRNFGITFQGVTLEIANAKGELFEFTQVADSAVVGAIQNFKSFTEEFSRGALTAEAAGQRIVAIETQLARARSELSTQLRGDISDITVQDLKRIETQEELLKVLEKQLDVFSNIKDELVTLEKLQKDIKSTVSGDIKEFERAALSGIVGGGGIAADQLTATRNQLQLQQSILKTTNETLKTREKDVASLKARLTFNQDIFNQLQANLKIIAESSAKNIEVELSNGKIVSAKEAQEMINRDIAKTESNIKELATEIAKKDSEIATKEAIIKDLASARLGSIIKLNDETTKLARAQEKALKAAETELKLLKLRNSLNQKNRELVQAKANDSAFIEGLNNELAINKALLKLAETQNSLAIKKRQLDANEISNTLKEAEASKKLLSIQSDLAQERIQKDFSQQIAPIARELADLEFFSNLATEEQRRQLREQIILLERDQQLAIIAEKQKQVAAEFQLNLSIVNARIAAANKAVQAAKDDKASLEERQRAELNLFDKRKEIERQQAQREINRIQDQRDVFALEKQIADTTAKAQLDRKLENIENVRRELAVIKERALTNNAFIKGQGNILKKFVEIVNAQLKATGLDGLGVSINTADFEKASTDTLTRITAIATDLQLQQNRAEDIFSEQLAESQAVKEAREKLNKTEETRLKNALESNTQLANIERQIIKTKQEIATADSQLAIDNAQQKLADFENEKTQIQEKRTLQDETFDNERASIIQNAQNRLDALARERAATLRLVNDLVDALNDGVGKALETIFDNIAKGKKVGEGLREVLFETFENARKTILKQTLIEPVQNFISESVGSFFGIGKKGADNASVVTTAAGDALLVSMASGGIDDPSSGVGKLLSGLDEAKQKSGEVATEQKGFFDSILEGFQTAGTGVKDFFGSIFSSLSGMFGGGSGSGGGGIFSMFSGVLGQGGLNFGQLFGGPSNAMLATGAATHSTALAMQQGIPFIPGSDFGSAGMFLASGGLVKRYAGGGNVISQDRVPALLQPGEFVMKRSAVNAMGANNMAMMNATGKSNGNVVVNIKNEGTPQDAQASQPKFDGEKMVIDIVTRDLRNNGPIRKSLRGGST